MDGLQASKVHGPWDDPRRPVRDTLRMGERAGENLRGWRELREMSQQQLADAIEPTTTKSVISALENGEMQMSEKWIRKLAPALKIRAGTLLEHHPRELDSEWHEAVEDVPPARRVEAIGILKVISKKS